MLHLLYGRTVSNAFASIPKKTTKFKLWGSIIIIPISLFFYTFM